MTIVYLNLNCKGVAAILPAFLLPFIKTRHESGGGGGVGGMRAVGMGRGSRSKGGNQDKKNMEEMEQRQGRLEYK